MPVSEDVRRKLILGHTDTPTKQDQSQFKAAAHNTSCQVADAWYTSKAVVVMLYCMLLYTLCLYCTQLCTLSFQHKQIVGHIPYPQHAFDNHATSFPVCSSKYLQ